MAGDCTCLHGYQRIAEQTDDDGVEMTSTPEEVEQRACAGFATRLCDRNPPSASTPEDSLSIEGQARGFRGTIEHFGGQDSSKASQGPLPWPGFGRFTLANLIRFALSSNRCHESTSFRSSRRIVIDDPHRLDRQSLQY
jgi:hypothetical protein